MTGTLDRDAFAGRLAIDTHLITSHRLLPLLIDRPGGLLVETTDGTAAVAITPGRLRSEMMLEAFGVTEENWRESSVSSADLADEYGFTDVDGSRPDVWRYNAEVDAGRDPAADDFR